MTEGGTTEKIEISRTNVKDQMLLDKSHEAWLLRNNLYSKLTKIFLRLLTFTFDT